MKKRLVVKLTRVEETFPQLREVVLAATAKAIQPDQEVILTLDQGTDIE